MKNLKIKIKLLISFMIIIGMMIVVGAIGLQSQVQFDKGISEIGSNRLPSVFALQTIKEAQKTIRSDEREILNPLTPTEGIAIQIKEIEHDCFAKIDKAWKIYEPLPQSKEEAATWKEFVPQWEKCREHHDKVLEMAKKLQSLLEQEGASSKDSAVVKQIRKINQYQRASRPDYNLSEKLLDKLVDINTEIGNDVVLATENEAKSNIILIVVILVLGISLALLLAIYISNSIAKGMRKIQNAAQDLANGNLSNTLDVDSKDEIGQLAESFRLVSTNLNAIVSAVDTTITLTKAGKIEQIHFNEKEYFGTYREIVAGLNEMAISVGTPLIEVLNIMQKMANGDLSSRMSSENLQGGWSVLRDAVHKTIDANLLVVENAQRIANGDLTVKIKPRSDKDELLLALVDMLEKLNAIMTIVIDSADNVAAGSAQISGTAAMMAQGSNEQASSAEEISASVEEMTSTIRQNTENALQTEVISREGAKGMMDVGAAAQKSMEAIRKINDRITVVDDIAEKTDILAINAAIEAARAGEHGKGFAVVASEVRKLAEMSQKAAKEINELSRTNMQLTEDAGVLMQTIMPNVQKTAQLVQEIAAASSEQSSGAQQISKAVEQFSQVTQQNSAASEELSSSSEELASQAETLKETIRFFKIEQKGVFSKVKKEKTPVQQHKQTNQANTNGVNIQLAHQNTDDSFETF